MIAALHDFSGQRFEVDAQLSRPDHGRARGAGRGARAGVGDLALVAADADADENRHEERGCIRRRAGAGGFLAP